MLIKISLIKPAIYFIIFLFLLIANARRIRDDANKFSDCDCNGKQFFISAELFYTTSCGHYVTCLWTLEYLQLEKDGIVVDPALGIGSPAELKKEYSDFLGSLGYPFLASTDFQLTQDQCKEKFVKCYDQRRELLSNECEREVKKRKLWPPREPPPYLNPWPWELGRHRWNKWKVQYWNMWKKYYDTPTTMPIPKHLRGFFNGTNTYTHFCPELQHDPHFTISLLLDADKKYYNQYYMFERLAKHLRSYVLQALWCNDVAQAYKDFYRSYNHSRYCHILWRNNLVCVNKDDDDLSRMQRDHIKECHPFRIPFRGWTLVDDSEEEIFYDSEEDYPTVEWTGRRWHYVGHKFESNIFD